MIVEFRTDDEDGSGVRSLEAWLVEDPALRTVTAQVEHTGDATQDMGSGVELLRVLVESGGIATTIATAVGAWLVSRSTGTRLRLRRGDVEVEFSARPGQDAEEVAMRILKELKET